MKRLLALAAVVALVALSCGDTIAPEVPTDTPPATTSPDGAPPAAGACLEGATDCQDIPGLDSAPPLDEDPLDDGFADSPAVVIDGALTVAEALATDAVGVIAVRGFVVADENGIRLCDALAESFPPQCGEASVELADLSGVDPDELTTAQGVTWTDQPVTILGELRSGVLVPDTGAA
jgi:hypothetical protein